MKVLHPGIQNNRKGHSSYLCFYLTLLFLFSFFVRICSLYLFFYATKNWFTSITPVMKNREWKSNWHSLNSSLCPSPSPSHHTNVCKISPLREAISPLTLDVSPLNQVRFHILRRFFQQCQWMLTGLYLTCEKQTHFRSSLLSLRKCVCCSQASLYWDVKKKKQTNKKQKKGVYTYQSCKTSVTLFTVSGVMSLPMAKSTSNCNKKNKVISEILFGGRRNQ